VRRASATPSSASGVTVQDRCALCGEAHAQPKLVTLLFRHFKQENVVQVNVDRVRARLPGHDLGRMHRKVLHTSFEFSGFTFRWSFLRCKGRISFRISEEAINLYSVHRDAKRQMDLDQGITVLGVNS
jgi:hypothetical protein